MNAGGSDQSNEENKVNQYEDEKEIEIKNITTKELLKYVRGLDCKCGDEMWLIIIDESNCKRHQLRFEYICCLCTKKISINRKGTSLAVCSNLDMDGPHENGLFICSGF